MEGISRLRTVEAEENQVKPRWVRVTFELRTDLTQEELEYPATAAATAGAGWFGGWDAVLSRSFIVNKGDVRYVRVVPVKAKKPRKAKR